MNFYLDFEATQFSERIISVGCVASNGTSFYSLVRPVHKDKVNKFITELTGITQEMVEDAPLPDEVFRDLRDFIRQESNSEETFFFTYGNADSHFIEHTAKYMEDEEAKQFALNLGASFIDYSLIACKFFHVQHVALKKIVAYFRGEPVIQNHNALEDAEMLREVAIAIAHSDCLAESPWEETASTQQEKSTKTDSLPIIMTTEAGETQIFKNRKVARDYIWSNLYSNRSRLEGNKKNITRRLNRCLTSDETYFKCSWKYLVEEKDQSED